MDANTFAVRGLRVPVPQHPEKSPASTIKAGRVVSTAGSQVVMLLSEEAAGLDMVRMGTLVRIRSPHATVFGLIEGLSNPMPNAAGNDSETGCEMRMGEIGLLGELPDSLPGSAPIFRRGVSNLPSLDAAVYLAGEDDIASVYSLPNRRTVRIGAIHQDQRVAASVSVDDMLGKHFAMLGSTGTGKSCAVTLVLKRILAQNPCGHILLLDPHGEYGAAFGSQAEHLTPDNFRLPYWLFSFEELAEVVFGAEKTQMAAEIAALRALVFQAKVAFAERGGDKGGDISWITVDTPVPYTFSEIMRLLNAELGALNNGGNIPTYLAIKTRLMTLQADRRYGFMFDRGLTLDDELVSILSRIFRIPADGRPLAILDLANIPSEALNVVVAVVCRLAFDVCFWGTRTIPLLLVCEEAHRYAPQDSGLGFEPAKRALSRIAKEGRKYGISLGVISQRPSELAQTILSQCNTVFAFRISNERDQAIIQASLPETSPAMFSALPFLGNGEAIATGEGVPIPMRLRFDTLPEGERPRSGSAQFSARWQTEGDASLDALHHIVQQMRGKKSR